MKSVLISIHPRHCENIVSGKKTIEVRKTAPKLKTSFKCFIYCTKANSLRDKFYLPMPEDWRLFYDKNGHLIREKQETLLANGKVVGEFVCDEIEAYSFPYSCADGGIPVDELNATCLRAEEFCKYGAGKTLYGWHISDLKIYDKPKELSEFTTPFCQYEVAKCKVKVGARLCKHFTFKDALEGECDYGKHRKHITRPPQSWCYVEEVEK